MQAQLLLAPLTWRQIAILLVGRLTLNTAFRVIYPLLEFFADGLRIGITTASLLITVQVAATLLSPLGGSLADIYGERKTMIGGLALFCVGAAVCAITTGFALFMVGYGLIGFATALYHPSAQTYASARTPYAQRGQVLGILEMSWALAALVGINTLSELIRIDGTWASAFWALFGLGTLILVGTIIALPAVPHIRQEYAADSPSRYRQLLQNQSVIAALVCLFCTLMAAELIFVVYASWLKTDFSATTEQLARAFALLGFVELAGSSGATLLVDRIGKRRTVLIAFSVVAIFQALLPISSGNWIFFLVLFYIFDLWFEFAIVSAFPLISGILPEARGTVLSLGVAAIGLGRVVASLVGPWIWIEFGFAANGLLAATMTVLGVLICWMFVREGET